MITFFNSISVKKETGKPPIDIYIVMGQSNAKGNGEDSGLPLEYRDRVVGANIFDWMGEQRLETLSPGSNTQTTDAGKHGAEVSFSVQRLAHSNTPFCIFKFARGGTSLAPDSSKVDWHPTSNQLAAEARNMIRAGIDLLKGMGYNVRIKSIFWHQGESDTGVGYSDDMALLVNYFDTEVPELANVKWTICRVFENGDNKILVNQEKQEHIATNPQRFLWQSPVEHYERISATDTTHANTAGLWQMGVDWYGILVADGSI